MFALVSTQKEPSANGSEDKCNPFTNFGLTMKKQQKTKEYYYEAIRQAQWAIDEAQDKIASVKDYNLDPDSSVAMQEVWAATVQAAKIWMSRAESELKKLL